MYTFIRFILNSFIFSFKVVEFILDLENPRILYIFLYFSFLLGAFNYSLSGGWSSFYVMLVLWAPFFIFICAMRVRFFVAWRQSLRFFPLKYYFIYWYIACISLLLYQYTKPPLLIMMFYIFWCYYYFIGLCVCVVGLSVIIFVFEYFLVYEKIKTIIRALLYIIYQLTISLWLFVKTVSYPVFKTLFFFIKYLLS